MSELQIELQIYNILNNSLVSLTEDSIRAAVALENNITVSKSLINLIEKGKIYAIYEGDKSNWNDIDSEDVDINKFIYKATK